MTRTNSGGFGNTTQGPDSNSFNLNSISTTTFNQLYATQFTILTTVTQTVDLTSLTNLVNESFGFGHMLTLMVLPVGSEVTVQPDATHGQLFLFGSTSSSLIIPDGGMAFLTYSPTGPGSVVDSTHKVLDFINSGLTTLTLDIVILGSTT